MKLHPKRAGLTLLELLLMMGLLVVVLVKAAIVMSTMLEVQNSERNQIDLEDQARQLLDRIAHEIMSCDYETLIPLIEYPNSLKGVEYRFAFGLVDGEVVWSDSQEIELEVADQAIWWRESPEGGDVRQVRWTNLVRSFLDGEVLNGIDDNGNGLVDERGLSFVLNEQEVTIRLTLERPGADGQPTTYTCQTKVYCRN